MKRYVIFRTLYGNKYAYIDRVEQKYSYYCNSIDELYSNMAESSSLIGRNGFMDKIYKDVEKYRKFYIIESDIPITKDNYPELFV